METAWNIEIPYRMIRDQYSAVTDRQRGLQSEQERIRPGLSSLRASLAKISSSIVVVESAGGDASDLRRQKNELQRRIAPLAARFDWLEGMTSRLAASLVHLGSLNDSIFCLNIEQHHLEAFERKSPEPPV